MKKITLGLGTIAAVTAPIAAVVACGEPDYFIGVDFNFKSKDNLLPTGTSTVKQDIQNVNIGEMLRANFNQDTYKEMKKISNHTDRSTVNMDFADSTVKVTINVKSIDPAVIAIDDIAISPKTNSSFRLDAEREHYISFKKHVQGIVRLIFETSQIKDISYEDARLNIFTKYAKQIGVENHFYPANADSTVPYDGTWETNVSYDRSAWYFLKDTEALKLITDVNNIASVSTQLDQIETKLSDLAVSLKGDAEFDKFAQAEIDAKANGQSQITLGTFMTKGSTEDDMIVFAINSLPKNLINKFMEKAIANNGLTSLLGKTQQVWKTLYTYSTAH